MTVQELVERDLKKAQINLEKAKSKPSIPLSELEHMEELCRLRAKIVELIKVDIDDCLPTENFYSC